MASQGPRPIGSKAGKIAAKFAKIAPRPQRVGGEGKGHVFHKQYGKK
jgi:hypothetical protein